MSRKKTKVAILMELLDGIPKGKDGDEEFNRFKDIFDYEHDARKKRAKAEAKVEGGNE